MLLFQSVKPFWVMTLHVTHFSSAHSSEILHSYILLWVRYNVGTWCTLSNGTICSSVLGNFLGIILFSSFFSGAAILWTLGPLCLFLSFFPVLFSSLCLFLLYILGKLSSIDFSLLFHVFNSQDLFSYFLHIAYTIFCFYFRTTLSPFLSLRILTGFFC